MERTKIRIVYLALIFILFNISYEEKVEIASTKLKSDIKNLSFISNLEERELENNYVTEYNKKKKNFRFSISLDTNIYRKKIDKLKTKDEKLLSLYRDKPSVTLKSNPVSRQLKDIYIEEDIPYLPNVYAYISNEGKRIELCNIEYSFIEKETPKLIDTYVLNDYISLITKLHRDYNKAKLYYIQAYSYMKMGPYFNEANTHNSKFLHVIIPLINKGIKSVKECMVYCKESEEDIRKKKNELYELIGNSEEISSFTQKIDNFKSNINEIKEKLIKDMKSIERTQVDIYCELMGLLTSKYCYKRKKIKEHSSLGSNYIFFLNSNYNLINKEINEYTDFSNEAENFMNYDSKLLIIKDKNFYQKKDKDSLKFLMEEINVIININKKNIKRILYNINSLKDKISIKKHDLKIVNLLEVVSFPSLAYNEVIFLENWNKKLKLDFEIKKKEIHDLFDKIKKELWDKIKSLVYPTDVASESEQINSDSRKILGEVNCILSENCEIIEDLSYSYSSPEIFTIKNELSKLYGEVAKQGISLKNKCDLINQKCDFIKSEKNQIETLKRSLPLDKSNILNDITEGVLGAKENIEGIIASANDKLQELKKINTELNDLRGKIEEPIKQIQTKKEKLKELEKKEDEEIKQVIETIKQELENIGEKISKLKLFMDLKSKENEDLKIIEKVIDESSFDNKDKYRAEMEVEKAKMESALKSLFDNKRIEKTYSEIPNYISEQKKLNYMIYDLSTVNGILKELKQKSTEIDNIIRDGTSIVENEIKFATKNIAEFRDKVITESIEDLHNKMKNSHETFNKILSFINDMMTDYENKKDKFKDCEKDIETKKCEFLDKFVEEDNDTLKGKDTFQETMSLKEVIKENKNLILSKINEGRNVVCTFKEQFEIYKKVEQHQKLLNKEGIFENLKVLKEKINIIEEEEKLNNFQKNYDSATCSIDDSVKKVGLSKKIIENFKILNKVINGANKNKELFEDLKRNLKELEDKVNKHIASINEDNLIEKEIKENFLSNLSGKKKEEEDQMRKIDELEKISKGLLESSINLKNNDKNFLIEEYMVVNSENVSNKEKNLESIIADITNLNIKINELNANVDNLVNFQNNKIANLIYDLIRKLYQEINSKIETSSEILKVTEKSFEKYKFEKDIKNVLYEINKEKLNEISQSFSELRNNINAYKEKFVEIQHKSKNEADNSYNIEKYNEKFNEKRSNMKKSYEKLKKELEDYIKVDGKLKNTLANINEKKLEYKKTLLYDHLDNITDIKRRGEEEIKAIDLYKERIEQLREKIPDIGECELENFNCEGYVNDAKKNKEDINILEQDVRVTRGKISSIKKENDINNIQMTVERKLKEVLNKKSKIDNASKIIKHMEKLLTLTKFSVVMEDIKNNAKMVKKEEENVKKEFTESENTKEKVMDDLKNAEKLRDLLINNLDLDSLNKSIEEIILVKSSIASKIENINEFLTKVEKHKVNSSLYFNNILRGKDKIIYLKNHDQEKIDDQVMEDVNKYVVESGNYLNKASKYTEETRKNYELSLKYEEKMNDILTDSLILAEKIKVEMKKNYVTDILVEMQNGYYDNIYILERLKNRLIRLKQEDINIKSEDEANNKKSIDAFAKIQITRTNANHILLYKEELKNSIINIISDVENKMDSFYTIVEKNYENPLIELETEKDKLKKISRILEEFEEEKKNLNIKLNNLKGIETITANLEDQMEIYKKYYEEGILGEIKKIADEYKKNIDILIQSIKLTIDTSIKFLKNSVLKDNDIIQKFKDPERKMNKIYDVFDKSYKEIEETVLRISKSLNTYNDVKEKKKKAKIEKEKLKELEKEMRKLLNDVKDIKRNEALRLILYMKNQLDEVNENSDKEYLELNEHAEDIKRNVQNIMNSKNINTALVELHNAKNKNSEFKKRKIVHSSYKDKSYFIYNEISKAIEFVDMNIESLSILEGYEGVENVEDIVLRIQGNSYDIDDIEKENEENIMIMKNIYEKIKIKEELKKKINIIREEVDKLLCNAQDSSEKYKKIKEIYIDKEYYEILQNFKEYDNFKKMTSSYEEKYNKMEIELKTDEIITEINKYKNFLNDLVDFIERLYIKKFTVSVIEKTEDYIKIISNKVVDTNNKTLEINASFYDLLELRKKCQLYFLSLVIAAINNEISKDLLLIKKKKNDSFDCVKYVINSYNSINNDIYTTNECFSRKIISSYQSNDVDYFKKLAIEFKIKERAIMEIIYNIRQIFLRVNKKKDSICIDENLQELKYLYKEFKEEKKQLKIIYKKMNETKLNEMDNSAKKFIDIAESYKNGIENEKGKILDIKNYIEKIEYFMKGEKRESHINSPMYTEGKAVQYDRIYNINIGIVIEIENLEKCNNSKNNKLTNHIKQISYLLERTISLLKDIELYQYESDDKLSKEEIKELLNNLNDYKKRTKSKIEESRRIFKNLLRSIDQIKEFIRENDSRILSIFNVVKKMNNVNGNNNLKVIKKLINNNVDNSSERCKKNLGLFGLNNENRKNKFDKSKIKLTVGILIGLIICFGGVTLILYKNKNRENDVPNKRYEGYEFSNDLYNSVKEGDIEIFFSG